MPKLPQELLPTAKVAELLGKDVRTVQRMADAGLLPAAMKLPGRTGAYLFRRDDVDRYLRDREPVAS